MIFSSANHLTVFNMPKFKSFCIHVIHLKIKIVPLRTESTSFFSLHNEYYKQCTDLHAVCGLI